MATWQRRSGIMLAYPFEEKRLAKWTPPFIVQPKLDGVRCRAIVTPRNEVLLLSSEEHPIMSVPHITDAIRRMSLQPGTELDGELYTHGMSFEEIVSRTSRTAEIHSDHAAIGYHVFDIVNDRVTLERLEFLHHWALSPDVRPPIFLVRTRLATTLEDIMYHLKDFHGSGYEGIIVRHHAAPYVRKRSTLMMKWKPKREDEYEIIAAAREVDQYGVPKDSLGALVCKDDAGNTFRVGTGFTREQRHDLWQRRLELAGKLVRVNYQHLTETGGVPRFPVFVEILDG